MINETSTDTQKILRAIGDFHAAHNNILLILVKSLDAAGALKAEDFHADLCKTTEYFSDKIGPDITSIIMDFAQQINPIKGRA